MMLIDDREHDDFKNHEWGFNTKVERLGVADYIVSEKVAIERKEINDFVTSLDDRKNTNIWEQVKNMEEHFDINWVVIHGRVADLNHRNMEPRKVQGIYGAIARLGNSYGINVLWVRGQSQAKKAIKKIHSKARTEETLKKPHLKKRSYRDDRVNVLYGIHGLGYKTINNLLDEFDSVAGVCQASEKELKKADGVGGKTASKIHDILHDGEQDDEEGLLAE